MLCTKGVCTCVRVAFTSMAKFKLPRQARPSKPAAGRQNQQMTAPPEAVDEVDAFHKSKDRLALDPDADSDAGLDVLAESEDEGVFDLQTADSEDLDSDEDEAQDKRLAACEPFAWRCCTVLSILQCLHLLLQNCIKYCPLYCEHLLVSTAPCVRPSLDRCAS